MVGAAAVRQIGVAADASGRSAGATAWKPDAAPSSSARPTTDLMLVWPRVVLARDLGAICSSGCLAGQRLEVTGKNAMAQLLLLGSAFWVGGAAAWAPIAGYLLAPHWQQPRQRQRQRQDEASPIRCQEVGVEELRRPEDASSLLTESERNRIAPVNALKRKRRSRKIRTYEVPEDKLLPLVAGAKVSVKESIMAAYAGDKLADRQRAGEDYYVDPALLQKEVAQKRAAASRRKLFKRRETAYAPEKLRKEITAPYRNNVISYIVVGIAIAGVTFALFPELLEENVALVKSPAEL